VSGIALVVDTNVFVSARNRNEGGSDACRAFLSSVDRGEVRGIVSTLTLAELRAGFTAGEVAAVWRPLLSHLLTSSNYRIEAVTAPIAERAGELRARYRLSLADAAIVATGLELEAAGLVSQDSDLRKKQTELPVRSPSVAGRT
jgi:predicted nucleic acid-binding protein